MGSTIRTNEEVKIINTESKSDLAGRNTQFALLQFFAIVAVVIGHIGKGFIWT